MEFTFERSLMCLLVEQRTTWINYLVDNEVCGLLREEQLLYNPYSPVGYELIYEHDSGGKVWRHELVDVKGIDYEEVLEIAVDKANIGCEVHVLPILPEDHPLRPVIFKDAKPRKCPDLRIDGKYVEVKTPTDILSLQKISRNIKVAHAQADHVVIRLTSEFNVENLPIIVKGRFSTHRHLHRIEFKMLNEYFSFRRSECI